MKSSSSLLSKIGLILVLAGLMVLPASFSNLGVRRVEARLDGASRLISVEPLLMDGAMCEYPPALRETAEEAIPINPVTVALALQQGASAPPVALAQQQAASARVPTEAQKAAVAARKPLRTINDRYPQFSAVAVDSERNEVVLQDENLFQVMVFDRTTNTPPRATMSEPKRFVRGPHTYLELNCAVYIDPKTGNIYSLNNDTERHMTVWDRQARGDASPAWKLRTPMGAFGLAVDEETEELLITAQHESSVSWFPKTASGDAPPTGVLQGNRTLLADPHGERSGADTGRSVKADPVQVGNSAETWEKVVVKLRARAMPPPGNRRPPHSHWYMPVTAGCLVASWLRRSSSARQRPI